MLRNDLITLLSQHANDTVTVDINGILIDVEAITSARDNIVLVLNPEDLRSTLQQAVAGRSTRRVGLPESGDEAALA